MPVYTYQCDDCGERFETRQRFSDDPLEVCELCEMEGHVHRVIQATGIIFKGSGFYVTDNGNAANGSSNGTTEAKESTTKKDAKGDSPKSNVPESKTA